MLPCRRHHTVLFTRKFLRSLALAQCPRFQLMRHCRFLHIVWCNLMLPHNSTSRSSSSAGFSQTVLWIVDILFVSPPPSVLGSHVVPLPPPGLEQPVPSPEIAAHSQSLTNASSSSCPTLQPTASTTHVGTHPVRPAGAKRSASTAHAGTHNSNGSCSRTDANL